MAVEQPKSSPSEADASILFGSTSSLAVVSPASSYQFSSEMSKSELDEDYQPGIGHDLKEPKSKGTTKAATELISLKLSQVNAASDTFLELFRVLKTNNSLVNLEISNRDGQLRNSNIQARLMMQGICPYLRGLNCLLNHLNIFGCQMGNQGFKRFAEAIVENTSLLSLNIGNNSLTGSSSAQKVVLILKYAQNLVDLNISHNNFENRGLYCILTALAQERELKIEHFNMSHCGAT